MDIVSAKYTKDADDNNSSILVTTSEGTIGVPLDPNNRHYQAIQDWVAEGNTIQDAD